MITIKWLPEALDDLKRLHTFIEPHSPTAAARAIDTIINSTETLIEFPEKGRPWDLEINFRELPIKFGMRGYVIRYRLIESQIIIVRVWHGLEDQ